MDTDAIPSWLSVRWFMDALGTLSLNAICCHAFQRLPQKGIPLGLPETISTERNPSWVARDN